MQQMIKRLLLTGFATVPLAAGADMGNFDYTYLEGVYVNSRTDVGPTKVDGDGFGIRGSYAVNDTFHVFASRLSQDMDFDIDSTVYDLGFGARWALQPNVHLVGELSYVNAKVDTSFGSAKDDGYGVAGGVRLRPTGSLELQGMVHYVDLGDSDTSLSLGARYHFTDLVSVGGGFGFSDDVTMWNLNVRAQFGRNGSGRR